MNTKKPILDIAKQTISAESKAIANLINFLDKIFENTVKFILKSKGRVIVTGHGKNANSASEIAAILNSTGTPSIFMHAADAIHGDLSIILKDDVVICISKNGNTPEIKVLIHLIKKYINKIITITRRTYGNNRRMLKDKLNITKLSTKDIMNRSPKIIDYDKMEIKAFDIMKTNNVSQLLVAKKNSYKGIVHLHDLLKEGII